MSEVSHQKTNPTKQLEAVLSHWSEAAKAQALTWYLFDGSLLCAQVLHAFPDGCRELHVAFDRANLETVKTTILPTVAEKMGMTATIFSRYAELRHKPNDRPLTVFFWRLRPMDEAERPEEYPGEEPLIYARSQKGTKKTYLPAAWLQTTAAVTLGEQEYPTLGEYKAYLTAYYADYENAFSDPYWCGMTEEEKADLQSHQQNCVEALAAMEAICQKEGLSYRLLAGSVLGAVRHGGFIPWDDDIDAGIRVQDLDKLEAALKEQLPEKFQLIQRKPDIYYPRMFAKICCDGRCCIDLFPLVPTSDKPLAAKFVWYTARVWRKLHYIKIGHYAGKKKGWKMKIATLLAKVLPDKAILRFAGWTEQLYAKKDAPCYVNIYSIYRREKETVPAPWVLNAQRMTFAGVQVPVMGYTEEYLRHMYGDYMALPLPWKRNHGHPTRFEIH